MKKSLILLAVLFLTVGLVGQDSAKTSKTKQLKWEGSILRFDKANSTMDVRGGPKKMDQTVKKVSYDSSTEWTKLGKPAQLSDFKEGSVVNIVGTMDAKGHYKASHVDMRE